MAQLAGDLSKVTSWEEGSHEGQGAEACSRAGGTHRQPDSVCTA